MRKRIYRNIAIGMISLFACSALVFAVGNFFLAEEVNAGSTVDLRAYGWFGGDKGVTGSTSPIGWVNFHCNNDQSCGATPYGVVIHKDTLELSGQAWIGGAYAGGKPIGWIDFDEGFVPWPAVLGGDLYPYQAKLEKVSDDRYEIRGWAVIKSDLFDNGTKPDVIGFVRFAGNNYSVRLNQDFNVIDNVNIIADGFESFAWAGNPDESDFSGFGFFRIYNAPKNPLVNPILSNLEKECGKITLSWQGVGGASEYHIYRRPELPPDDYSRYYIKTVLESSDGSYMYDDTDIFVGQRYCYYVTVVKDGVESVLGRDNQAGVFCAQSFCGEPRYRETAE